MIYDCDWWFIMLMMMIELKKMPNHTAWPRKLAQHCNQVSKEGVTKWNPLASRMGSVLFELCCDWGWWRPSASFQQREQFIACICELKLLWEWDTVSLFGENSENGSLKTFSCWEEWYFTLQIKDERSRSPVNCTSKERKTTWEEWRGYTNQTPYRDSASEKCQQKNLQATL